MVREKARMEQTKKLVTLHCVPACSSDARKIVVQKHVRTHISATTSSDKR